MSYFYHIEILITGAYMVHIRTYPIIMGVARRVCSIGPFATRKKAIEFIRQI